MTRYGLSGPAGTWLFLLLSSAGVMLGCIAVCAAISWHLGRPLQWPPMLVISAGATAIYAARSWGTIGRLRMATSRRLAPTREAIQELVDDMARLSPADLSIFVAAAGREGDEVIAFGTTGGSPNHRVLVQMTDLGLAAPDRMETMGAPEHRFTFAAYRLTTRGRASLGSLLAAVAKRRRWFGAHGG